MDADPQFGWNGTVTAPVAVSGSGPRGPARRATYGDSRDPGFVVKPASDDRTRAAATGVRGWRWAGEVATGGKSRGPGFSRQNSPAGGPDFRRKCPGHVAPSGQGGPGRAGSGGMVPDRTAGGLSPPAGRTSPAKLGSDTRPAGRVVPAPPVRPGPDRKGVAVHRCPIQGALAGEAAERLPRPGGQRSRGTASRVCPIVTARRPTPNRRSRRRARARSTPARRFAPGT